MAVLTGRRGPLVLGAAALALLVALAAVAARPATTEKQMLVAFAAVIVVAGLVLLPYVEPAVPLTAGLVTAVFSGNWGLMGVPQGLDRPLLLYGILGVLWRLGRDRSAPRPRVHAVHWLLLAFGLYAILSASFAGTLTQRDALFALFDKLGFIGFLVFLLAPVAFAKPRARDGLLAALIALAAYLGLTALFEGLGLDGLVFPRYINDPSVGLHVDRARGPFIEAAANGLALYIGAVCAAMGFARWKRPRVRVLCAAIAVLCLLGVILTLTRQTWLAAGVATIVTLLVVPRLRRYLIPTAILGVIGVVAALTFIPGLNHSATSRAEDKTPVWDRLNSNRAGLLMLQDRPLAGFGWYRFAAESPPYYRQSATYPLTTIAALHNLFLANAVDLGVIATVVWLVALFGAFGIAVLSRPPPELEIWRVGLIAVAVAWFAVANFTPFAYAYTNHIIWFFMGIVWTTFLRRPAAGAPVRATERPPAPVAPPAPQLVPAR